MIKADFSGCHYIRLLSRESADAPSDRDGRGEIFNALNVARVNAGETNSLKDKTLTGRKFDQAPPKGHRASSGGVSWFRGGRMWKTGAAPLLHTRVQLRGHRGRRHKRGPGMASWYD